MGGVDKHAHDGVGLVHVYVHVHVHVMYGITAVFQAWSKSK